MYQNVPPPPPPYGAPPYGPYGPQPYRPPVRHWRRSTTNRRIAGVLGGLAEYLGVRPGLVRAGFVIVSVWLLAIGGGILLYLLAWAFVPEQGTNNSLAQGAFGGTPWANWDRTARSWVIVLGSLVLLSLWTFGLWPWWHWAAVPVWLIVAGVVVWALARHQSFPGPSQGSPSRAAYPGPWAGGTSPGSGGTGPGASGPPPDAPTGGTWGAPAAGSGAAASEGAWRVTPAGTVQAGAPNQEQADRAAAESAAQQWAAEQLAAAGVPVTPRGATAPGATNPALASAQRHRALVTTAVAALVGLLLLAIIATAGVVRWSGAAFGTAVGNLSYTPANFSEVHASYQEAIGRLTIDLSHVKFPPGGKTVKVDVGLGQLIVVVPNETAVVVDAQTGIGHVNLPRGMSNRTPGGTGSFGSSGTERPRLTLDANVGIGDIKVSRAGP
jgi:phage shock protein PspC (stress-responsive transcriptional regulator)